MERYIISAIMLYALVVAIYLLRERMQKRKKNAAKNSGFNPFRSSPKEDIVGKSKFDLRQSRTEATTLINNEKGIENEPIFADENKKDTPVTPPLVESEIVLSAENMTDENSNEINLVIENTAPEFEPEYNNEDIDKEETEDEDTEGVAGVSIALGLGFDELAGMVRTVETADAATSEEKEEAGRVLVEIRKTEMFDQVVGDEPKKKVVSALMDDYFSAFHRKKREAGETDEPIVKAPKDFNVRGFA
ncbi:hypothetical protein [Bacteroides sp. D2]|uniref:hypothetical protein n=1 Tax=Bacteroides sp. D2 TaxID=556259 RepID=UPI0001BC7EE9|nr:hypothetical protein [Bacteroides sp. D2]EFS29528.1 hypothetical protein BSGG_0228 [Bacteroides sp. D2]UWN98135.1 hypothetical protein NQ505_17060 [Bacteroides sp. D2]